MPQPHTAQQDGPLLVIITRGQTRPVDDLTDTELAALAQRLSDQLAETSAMLAYRHAEPTDAELCAMADYYEEAERGRREMEDADLERRILDAQARQHTARRKAWGGT
jgi:hypothetical protein